jgi:hypothetical protein
MFVGVGIASQVGSSYVWPSGTMLQEIHGFAVVRSGASRVCAPENQPMPTLPSCSVTDRPGTPRAVSGCHTSTVEYRLVPSAPWPGVDRAKARLEVPALRG